MAKYPISKEFFPFNLFAPPMSKKFVLLAQKYMKTPKLLWKDPDLDVQTRMIPGYQGGEIEVYIITPKNLSTPAPCLVNFHGGGFVFEGYNSHYQMAMAYAREGRCKVVYGATVWHRRIPSLCRRRIVTPSCVGCTRMLRSWALIRSASLLASTVQAAH